MGRYFKENWENISSLIKSKVGSYQSVGVEMNERHGSVMITFDMRNIYKITFASNVPTNVFKVWVPAEQDPDNDYVKLPDPAGRCTITSKLAEISTFPFDSTKTES